MVLKVEIDENSSVNKVVTLHNNLNIFYRHFWNSIVVFRVDSLFKCKTSEIFFNQFE